LLAGWIARGPDASANLFDRVQALEAVPNGAGRISTLPPRAGFSEPVGFERDWPRAESEFGDRGQPALV